MANINMRLVLATLISIRRRRRRRRHTLITKKRRSNRNMWVRPKIDFRGTKGAFQLITAFPRICFDVFPMKIQVTLVIKYWGSTGYCLTVSVSSSSLHDTIL